MTPILWVILLVLALIVLLSSIVQVWDILRIKKRTTATPVRGRRKASWSIWPGRTWRLRKPLSIQQEVDGVAFWLKGKL